MNQPPREAIAGKLQIYADWDGIVLIFLRSLRVEPNLAPAAFLRPSLLRLGRSRLGRNPGPASLTALSFLLGFGFSLDPKQLRFPCIDLGHQNLRVDMLSLQPNIEILRLLL